MKLLLDENLSLRLVESLADLYPELGHVHNFNLGGADDAEVWDYAKLAGGPPLTLPPSGAPSSAQLYRA